MVPKAVGTACANLQGREHGSISSKVGDIAHSWIIGYVYHMGPGDAIERSSRQL